jgi:hypothetical protein
MNSRKTLALAEFPLKRDVATDCRSQGPMSQQITDGSGGNELHPQVWCSWSAFVIPMHESTKKLHRPQQSSLLQREPSYAE